MTKVTIKSQVLHSVGGWGACEEQEQRFPESKGWVWDTTNHVWGFRRGVFFNRKRGLMGTVQPNMFDVGVETFVFRVEFTEA